MPVTQVLEFDALTGQTISCKLFALGSDTLVATATASEKTNDQNRYSVTFTDIPAGTYRLNGFVSSYPGRANEVYDLLFANGTYYPRAEKVAQITTGIEANAYTVTVEASGGSPIANVPVSIELSGEVIAWGRTNTSGQVVFGLAAGTYSVVIGSAAAYQPASPVSVTIPTTSASTITLTPQSIAAPATPGLCTVRFAVVHNGAVVSGATVSCEVDTINSTVDSALVARTKTTGTTNGSGYVDLTLIRLDAFTAGGTYRVLVSDSAGVKLYSRFVTVPNANTCFADDLVPV